MSRAPFRHLFVPTLVGVSVGAWLARGRVTALLVRGRWGIDFTTLALLVSMALVFVAEQLFPARPEWNFNLRANPVRGLDRLGRDLFYLTFVTLLNGLVTGAVAARAAGLVATVRSTFAPMPTLWPEHWPFAVRVVLAFLLIELGSYAYHRAAHRFRPLWGFHATHHVITEVTGLKALRTHPVDNALFYLPRMLPALLLGAGPNELVAATYFGCVLGVLSHANVDVATTGLGWFVNFPQYHFVHHSSALAESRSNFGCHTVLWDRVFGTFRAGPTGAPVGVDPVGPRTLWQELAWPFYRPVDVSPEAERQASPER